LGNLNFKAHDNHDDHFVLAMISPESFQDQNYIGLKGVNSGNWKLEKNSGGVQSYVRFITNSKGTDLRERKGEMTVNCSVQDAVRLLTDAGLPFGA
jgi:hypothetical protein